MNRMADMIRHSTVPDTVLRSAAAGTVELPPAEKVEVLVLLADHPLFGQMARTTIAQLEEEALLAVVSDTLAPKEVLNFFLAPPNRRPGLMPALIANPAVPESTLAVVAETASRTLLETLLENPRSKKSPEIMMGLAANAELYPIELQNLKEQLKALGQELADTGSVFDFEWALWMMDHAAEIAAEEGKAFELVDSSEDEKKEAETAAEPEKLSTLQKLARMTVGERVQRAFKGDKEERAILIRDGAKVVSHAVLESPKITDSEVETFAAMKNVQESVLRAISMKRRFMKNYSVIRALANNPRCPLDLGLTLLNHLMTNDLKALGMNKNVADTMRKMAVKKAKEKATTK
jgi:hypothetical protein